MMDDSHLDGFVGLVPWGRLGYVRKNPDGSWDTILRGHELWWTVVNHKPETHYGDAQAVIAEQFIAEHPEVGAL